MTEATEITAGVDAEASGRQSRRPIKLIIQIPCFNEEETLGIALDALPTEIAGIDVIERLIIDDGSSDRTVEVAREWGVEHIVRLPSNRGLARGFMAGIEGCLARGADIIVNTDADNQYCADDIPALIQPILDGRAEMVVGARPITEIEHFSPVKKMLQKLGSWVVRVASRTDVPDAPSGFRAFSRNAAMKLNVFSGYTYTLETIIEAGRRGISITSVPVRTNEQLRPSRLMSSIPSYLRKSMLTILRIFMVYEPARTFSLLGAVPFTLGTLLGVRWLLLHLWLGDPTRGYTPSLILAAVLLLMGFLLWVVALLGELLSVNRKLSEDIQTHLRHLRFGDNRRAGDRPQDSERN